MLNMRRRHDAAFKSKVALEAVKGAKTIAQISSEFGVHANQIRQWRKHLLEELPSLFSDQRQKTGKDREEVEAELYRQIGQLKVTSVSITRRAAVGWQEGRGDRLEVWEAGCWFK